MTIYNNFESVLKTRCDMNGPQIKMTFLAMVTILFQGVAFSFLNKNGIKLNYFILAILFGFIYYILFYKTFL